MSAPVRKVVKRVSVTKSMYPETQGIIKVQKEHEKLEKMETSAPLVVSISKVSPLTTSPSSKKLHLRRSGSAGTSPHSGGALQNTSHTYTPKTHRDAHASEESRAQELSDDEDDDNDEWLYMTGKDMKAQKERSYHQMIEVMNAELAFWRDQVRNLYAGCAEDLNPKSSFRYSMVPFVRKPMAIDEDEEKEPKFKRGQKKSETAEEDTPGGCRVLDASKLTFKGNAPSLEAGRNLDIRFEELKTQQEEQRLSVVAGAGHGGVKSTRHRGKRKVEPRNRKDRLQVERRLNANLDKHVARSVNELTYYIPHQGRKSEVSKNSEISRNRRGSLIGVASSPSKIRSTTPVRGERSSAVLGLEDEAEENWPIPIDDFEMDPRLFLTYSCERIDLPSGARFFRFFVLSGPSRRLFLYLYWFAHCKFFQENSEQEQAHLLAKVSSIYVQMLQMKALDQNKDFFFKYYPYVMANAVYWGFYYLCPGSRHLYTGAFRKILYKETVRLLSGIDVCPISVTVVRSKLYPDEAPEEEGTEDVDFLPPIRQQRNSKSPQTGLMGNDSWAQAMNGLENALRPKVKTLLQSQSEPVLKRKGGLLDDDLHKTPEKEDQEQLMKNKIPSPLSFSGRLKPVAMKGSANQEEGFSPGSPETAHRHHRASGTCFSSTMNLSSEQRPINHYIGSRDNLRFKEKAPDGLKKLRPRQERETFDGARISPMLQEFLKTSSTAGRRAEPMVRTVPVSWCATGSSDTFHRTKSNKEYHEDLMSTFMKQKEEFHMQSKKSHGILKGEIVTLKKNLEKALDKGEIGRKALEIVHELEQNKQKQKSTVQSTMLQRT